MVLGESCPSWRRGAERGHEGGTKRGRPSDALVKIPASVCLQIRVYACLPVCSTLHVALQTPWLGGRGGIERDNGGGEGR
jgi:hypothetical protein